MNDSAARRVNNASAAARFSTDICQVRTLIDNADENSVTTQSLISRSSALWPLRQAYTRAVANSLVSAVTKSEASR
jgi:hypothetical protein